MLKIIKFWVVAFGVIIWHTCKKRQWHMLYADFEVGKKQDGSPLRKQLIARRTCSGFDLYWQDMNKWLTTHSSGSEKTAPLNSNVY